MGGGHCIWISIAVVLQGEWLYQKKVLSKEKKHGPRKVSTKVPSPRIRYCRAIVATHTHTISKPFATSVVEWMGWNETITRSKTKVLALNILYDIEIVSVRETWSKPLKALVFTLILYTKTKEKISIVSFHSFSFDHIPKLIALALFVYDINLCVCVKVISNAAFLKD